MIAPTHICGEVGYVAGRFRAPTREGVLANIAAAVELGSKLSAAGFPIICPHANSDAMDQRIQLPDEFWLRADLLVLERCNWMAVVPGWESSTGTQGEIARAEALGLPVYGRDCARIDDVVREVVHARPLPLAPLPVVPVSGTTDPALSTTRGEPCCLEALRDAQGAV